MASEDKTVLAAAAGGEEAKAEVNEFLVYDDDACLGKLAPGVDLLKFKHGETVEIGKGKVSISSFCRHLLTLSFLHPGRRRIGGWQGMGR